MSGKGGKPAAAKGKKGQAKSGSDEKQDDILKAVIIADTFQDRFMPFAVQKPRCLLPLANTPLIDYTLEFLSSNYVQEVYIYASAHEKQVREHVEGHPRWGTASRVCPFDKIEFIPVADATSMGDFLRDLDKRTKMTTDFILVHGDLVANIDLEAAMAAHRARREENRDAMMTMVLRAAGTDKHHTKMQGITPVFTVDPNTSRCLAYDEMTPLDADKHLWLDAEHLDKFSELELRADLIDPGIDICTPDVLAMWSESFDHQLPRKNFLREILKDFELNGKMIFTEIIDHGYAARASNLQLYDGISKDVLGRWTMPYVPDCNLMPGQAYNLGPSKVSMEDCVKVVPTAHLEKCVVGSNSSFGAGTSVSGTIIGRNCTIGKDVTIRGSFLWDDVTVADGATIERSIIASEAKIGRNCKIPVGSLISFGVEIGDDVQFAEEIHLSTVGPDGIKLPADTVTLGSTANGAVFHEPDDDVDPRDPARLQKSLIYSTAHLNISEESISTFCSDSEQESESEPETPSAQHHRTPSQVGGASFGFHADAVNGILDTLRATNASDGDFGAARLELTGLRLATNASSFEVTRAVAVAFAKRAAELHLGQDPSSAALLPPVQAAQKTMSVEGADKLLIDIAVGGDESEKQVAFILALQHALLAVRDLDVAKAGNLLSALMQQMYSADVLSQEGIEAWWEDKRSQDGEGMTETRERTRPLVEWLQESDEESDEEDE